VRLRESRQQSTSQDSRSPVAASFFGRLPERKIIRQFLDFVWADYAGGEVGRQYKSFLMCPRRLPLGSSAIFIKQMANSNQRWPCVSYFPCALTQCQNADMSRVWRDSSI
jgi:hypothetical protein